MRARRFRGAALGLRRPRIAAASAIAVGVLSVAASPAYADVTSVSGGAFGESVNVTPLGLLNVTSGPLPTVTLPSTGGGPFTATLGSVCAASPTCSVLSTGIVNLSTQGTTGPAGGSSSSASVTDVNGLASALKASAVTSSCTVGPNSSSGSSQLVGASLGGTALPVNPAPNTTITVAGVGTVILNQQIPSGGAGNYSLTVNAINLTLLPAVGVGSIIISQSRCGEIGPDVTIPFAPIGILGATAVVGAVLVRRQLRRPNADDSPAITG